MNRTYQLKQDNGNWQFISEAALEDFVWDHLEPLFQLKPLRRQHHSEGNYCDILAVADNGRLAIIELKNAEDRYVIQQVTRYYHALLLEKPFGDRVDYSIPVSLMVISPVFHKDNHIDCLYTTLKFDLFQFSITGDTIPVLRLDKVNAQQTLEIPIPYQLLQEVTTERELPPPPRSLMTALARCTYYDTDLILRLREKILKFDSRIQEIQIKLGQFAYGKGKSNAPADFMTKKTENGSGNDIVIHHPFLALRLPISFGETYRFSRVTIPNALLLPDVSCWVEGHYWWSESKLRYYIVESYKLCQKGVGRTQKISRDWEIKSYLRDFLKKELGDDRVDYDALPQNLETYCHQQGFTNGSKSNAAFIEFLIEFSLRTWVKQL